MEELLVSYRKKYGVGRDKEGEKDENGKRRKSEGEEKKKRWSET